MPVTLKSAPGHARKRRLDAFKDAAAFADAEGAEAAGAPNDADHPELFRSKSGARAPFRQALDDHRGCEAELIPGAVRNRRRQPDPLVHLL